MTRNNSTLATLDITGTSHDGRGIANIDGKVVFVWGAIKGEQVQVEITNKRSQFLEAKTIDVLRASDHRVEPRCAHFGVCGGCSLQHLNHQQQIQQKQVALLDQLQRSAKVQPQEIMPPIVGPDWGYRHKARLGVKFVAKKDKVLVGFREQAQRYLADLSECHVLHPSIGEHLPLLSNWIASLSNFKQIPQLEIAVGDQVSAIIIRHLQPFSDDDIEQIIHFAKTNNFHIYLQPKGPKTVHKIWPNDNNDRLHYQIEGLTLAFHPNDFTQVNPDINRKMVARAIEWLELGSNDDVLDLFCGLGNFSLPMAKRCSELVGVEGSDLMVERAYENARQNQIDNVKFYSADLSQSIDGNDWAERTYDKVLFDPPRSGAQAMVPYLAIWKPQRLVYVSCNPATLARDTADIIAMGYKLAKAGVLDMFPHTSHVESIALFTKE